MRALRFDRYGSSDVLHVAEIVERDPDAGEAKVRVHAVALNPLDWKVRAGDLRFLPVFRGPPRGLGCDFAGEIVGVGGGATARHRGEIVFGSLLPFARDGALADYVIAPVERLLPVPSALDEIHAAALPIAGSTALSALSGDAVVTPGQRVLVTGAAGGVGHFAVQVANHLGARVTGVCSAANVEFVRGLGADDVIDYDRDDFTRRDERFDVVFDAACVSTFEAARRVLEPHGVYLNTGGNATAVARTLTSGLVARLMSRQRAIAIVAPNRAPTWQRLLELIAAGALRVQVEQVITLDDVPGALRHMETGHGRGKIVVRIDSARRDHA